LLHSNSGENVKVGLPVQPRWGLVMFIVREYFNAVI